MLDNAPHLVGPLPLVLPVFRGSKHSPAKLRIGMRLYDYFSRGDPMPRHRWFSRKQTGDRWPELTMEGLVGSFRYFDAQATFPERLVVEQIVSAVSFGAVALNYARVTWIDTSGSVVTGLTFIDEVSGQSHSIRAEAVVNVAGPWVDDVLASLDPRPKQEISGTKGSHIFLPATGSEPTDAIYTEAASDGRPFFIVPWNGLTMIGTTDLPFSGNLDDVIASEEEIDYLLAEATPTPPAFLRSDTQECAFHLLGSASPAGGVGHVSRPNHPAALPGRSFARANGTLFCHRRQTYHAPQSRRARGR